MSITLQNSVHAIAILEYKSKKEYPELSPRWIKEKQLSGYYNSVNIFFSESLDELNVPERFDKQEIRNFLMDVLKRSLNEDDELRKLIISLGEYYPRFPIGIERASNYLVLLKKFCHYCARQGHKLNAEYAIASYTSDIPYFVFSNLILGNYTTSYFFEYKARATEQYFRQHYLLIRGRPNLPFRKSAINSYFEMMTPVQETFQRMIKSQFKLQLVIFLSNSKNMKEFSEKPQFLSVERMDQKQLGKLTAEHSEQLDRSRRLLFQLEPDLFKPSPEIDDPTQTMWRDMVLLRMTK